MTKSEEIRGFERLIAWQKAMNLAECIFLVTRKPPFSIDYGLVNQIRRAAISIPSTIAEGHGRYSAKDYLHFLAIANGSANEVRTQIQLANRFDYVDREVSEDIIERCGEVSRIIKGIRKSIESRF